MVIERSARFDEEAARFSLRYTCEDCGHFDARTERCLHEWPVELHRRKRYEVGALVPARDVVFCKEFEVG